MSVEFIRVTDDVKPRREYSIPASAFDEAAHVKVDKPATHNDGSPLPPKFTPESLSSSGHLATTTEKEKD